MQSSDQSGFINHINAPIIILGAGLAGLTLAYRLKQQGVKALILEARKRPGGRIETLKHGKTTLELGATWFADKHVHLNRLLSELGLEKLEQDYGKYAIYEMADSQPVLYPLPAQPEATYRIKGGSQALIDRLANELDTDQVAYEQVVKQLDFSERQILVKTDKRAYRTSQVVNTLPPNLLVQTITISPDLPSAVKGIYTTTHTWMGESIKAGIISNQPFWTEREIGTLYSQTGAFTEMYDHSSDEGFAMKGFLHDQLVSLSDEERQQLATKQLAAFFGSENLAKSHFVQKAWKDDHFTYAPYEQEVFPHQNNGHGLLREPLYEGRFLIAGSETAASFPGYMDGAVEAAERVMTHLTSLTQTAAIDKP